MAYVTEAQIEKAKRLDLLTYLEICEPQELVRLSNRIYSTKSHDSVVIRNGAWFRNATGDYGFTGIAFHFVGYHHCPCPANRPVCERVIR